ncbi:MAG: hypothetical protein AAF467_13450 [Actinomycetota bacterium]
MLAAAGGLVGLLLLALVAVQVVGGDDGDEVATVTAPSTTDTTELVESDADPAELETSADGTSSTTTSSTRLTTAADITVTTVEADDVVQENADPAPDEDEDAVDSTQPTAPPPTDGGCEVALAELGGQVGTIDAGTSGACGPLAVTIRPVDATDDLADVNWSTDLRVCERHPSASAVSVTVTTAAAAVSLVDPFVRPPAEADSDPVQSIGIVFPSGFAPDNGVQPLVVCRTSGAELSIVHWPTR